MSARQLILLSPYRLPTDTTSYISDDEAAAILNGHQALWHPAALALAASLPRIAAPYDHEEPVGDAVYALPDNPPLSLADDWRHRAAAAGAIVFDATADRAQTIANLREALGDRWLVLPDEKVKPFLGLGYGYAVLEALFEAMSHENAIPHEQLLGDLRAAVENLGDDEAWRPHVQTAADRLLAAREVAYPVTLYLVELFLVDPANPAGGWPEALAAGLPVNVVACGRLVEKLAAEQPERFGELREKVGADTAEIACGGYTEREEPLSPLESQMWNLRKGQAVLRDLVGREAKVYGRRRFGFHPQTPLFLQNAGFSHALLLAFDDGQLPSHYSPVVNWPSHDGKQVDGFARTPQPAESPQTYFHLAHHLQQCIAQDQSATLALLHKGHAAPPWYGDWVELSRLAPVLGRRVTLSSYFSEVMPGDYATAAQADELSADYLSERTASTSPDRAVAISGFARLARERRRVDAAWTFATVLRTLGGEVEASFFDRLAAAEDRFEKGEGDAGDEMRRAAEALARRLVARGQANNPGWMLLNPCAFTRRVVVELPGLTRPVAAGGPVKACQGESAVVELPALGFAWVPRDPPEGPAITTRLRLADERAVRNEFFEAEIDPNTGGLRDLRDVRTRVGRLGQQLVWNPGSAMKATKITTTSAGPALGEVVTEGVLSDEGREVATFRQRFRAWLGRPMLDIRIEIEPTRPAEGYAWHSYFAARFAWRTEAAALARGVSGLRSASGQNRPESPDYVEVRTGRQNAVIFPGGLPFHQRHGGRMLDVVLVCEGESARAFDLGIALDREQPAQTALGVVSPVAVVETAQGPPHVGAAGWLFHLDAANLMLTSLRPAPDHEDAILATLLECTGAGGPAQLRCVRDPVRASVQDLTGAALVDAAVSGDAVEFEASANDLLQLRVEFR